MPRKQLTVRLSASMRPADESAGGTSADTAGMIEAYASMRPADESAGGLDTS